MVVRVVGPYGTCACCTQMSQYVSTVCCDVIIELEEAEGVARTVVRVVGPYNMYACCPYTNVTIRNYGLIL